MFVHSDVTFSESIPMDDTIPQRVNESVTARRFMRSYFGWGLMGLALLGLSQLIALVMLYVPNLRERQAAEVIAKAGGAVEFYDPPGWIPRSLYHNSPVLPVYRRIRIVSFQKTMPETLPSDLKLLSALEQLYLHSPAFTDEGLKQLNGLRTLKTLELRGTSITDDGLKSLDGLPSLRILDLNDTKIGDSGIASLTRFDQLRWISLEGTQVTDDGLAPLRELPFLRRLDLARTQITDKGLENLVEIKTLEMLNLSPNQVTVEGLARLKTAQPNCAVYNY